MTSCGPYKPTAGGCTPHTEVFWARKESDASPVLLYLQVTCVAGKAVKTLTTDKAGTTPAVGYTEADKIGTVIKGERGASCEDPVHVKICDPAAIANLKIEFSEQLMHSASTEQTVMRIREYNEDTGVWSLRYENLDGTPFVGALPADLTVASAQVAVTQTALLGCAAGMAYEQRTTSRFDAETGVLESTLTTWYDSTGAEFVVAPAGFALGDCQPTVYIDRPICSNTTAGEIWNMVERTSTNAQGIVTVAYLDPDTSPMVDVTSLFDSIRHGGGCDCCNDLTPPLLADLQILKSHFPAQVFVGDQITYTILVTNNGPDAADGASVIDNLPAGFALASTSFATTGGASGVSGAAPNFAIATFPAGSTVTITMVGTVLSATLANTAEVVGPAGVDFPTGNNTSTTTPTACAWEEHHELIVPISTLMGVYGTGGSAIQNLGFVDFTTGALTGVGVVAGANLNALGLDKSTNNAVFLDRNTGNIYTAYSPAYAIANPSVLQAGPVSAGSAILGALNSAQEWWVGNIAGTGAGNASITVSKVDPQTGIQTAVPSLTATLPSGSNGYDFDFAPNDDLYALVGFNIYLSTFASGYAGWTAVGTVSGIGATAGSLAYDQGVLRGTSSTGQLWQFDISTGVTTITGNMPAGTTMADMSGAVDPVCKRFYRNSCTGVYYELNKIVVYTPLGTPIAGGCQ